ncbi:DUF7521 family protein [Halegenticoccus tardaugens]|uniref:DUF7521 family protein n=1 Tax=Halegenticoccus tardaugens TaxID=2071624 RepID=UPI00100BBC6D|nr:hypothetical protein [Halegenticoccus tardaugens]
MSFWIIAGNLLAIALGFLIAYQAYRGYRRNRSEPMLFISIGFVLISVGGVLDCSLFDVVHVALPFSALVRTAFVLTGMGFISYSLYM